MSMVLIKISVTFVYSKYATLDIHWPIAVATRSKEWVCRRSFAGNAGLNPAREMDVRCL